MRSIAYVECCAVGFLRHNFFYVTQDITPAHIIRDIFLLFKLCGM